MSTTGGTRSRGRQLVAVAGAVTGVVAVRGVLRRRHLTEAVAPELRNPALLLPVNLTSDRRLRAIRSLTSRQPSTATVATSDRIAPGVGGPDVPVVVYEPPDHQRPSAALLWIHGGGMVLGTPKQGDGFCSQVADELGMAVVSVDYRLAPEDPFPAGLDDCVTALRWMHDMAADLGVDPDRIAIGGDSAGGGLAAALAQVAKDEGGPPVAFQLLVYPMLDDRTALRHENDGRGAFIWTAASNRYGWTAYLGHEPTEREIRPYAAPARREDMTGLAPAWIGVGDLDLFHAEDVDYAARLAAAGVTCELHVEPAMYHGADAIVPGAASMQAFRTRMIDALRSGLER